MWNAEVNIAVSPILLRYPYHDAFIQVRKEGSRLSGHPGADKSAISALSLSGFQH